MAKLLYASNTSLDGWTETASGDLAWAPPDDDVFVHITGLMGSVGTYLYGRRMYEAMSVWETDPTLGAQTERYATFARTWKGPDKVVYSTTLTEPATARTRIERSFDVDAVRALKEGSHQDLLIGGPHLAAQAIDAGLVDEVILFVWPIVLGGGQNPALAASVRLDLALVEHHPIGTNGVLHLRYRVG